MASKGEEQISVTLKLDSPTKAQRWDPRPATPISSSNYTLIMANAWDIDEDTRKEIYAERVVYARDCESLPSDTEDLSSDAEGVYCDTEAPMPEDIDMENLIPEWESLVDFHFDFEWLEVIHGKVTYQPDSLSPVEQVAHSTAYLIRRNWIADTFWDDMGDPEGETAELAFDLFNRFGSLKSQYKEHPVHRGSGVWGNELDRGDILLIGEITVSEAYKRRGIGSTLAHANLELASEKSHRFIAVVLPEDLGHQADTETYKASEDDQEASMRPIKDAVLSFWRALGFRRIGSSRWLGYSPDERHPSRALAVDQDFNLPHFPRIPTLPAVDDFLKALPIIDDLECLNWLQTLLGNASPNDPKWGVIDNDRNTLLHLVPIFDKTQSTQWLIQKNPNLLSQRNAGGYTPLEAFEMFMEQIRTTSQYSLKIRDPSDLFRGFDNGTVSALAVLKGLVPDQMSADQHSQLKLGCTCGSCLGGFLSPRLRHMMFSTAEETYDMIYIFANVMDGESWCSINGCLLEDVPKRILQSLATSVGLRTGFCKLWKYLCDCIGQNTLPTEDNVLALIRNSNEWPPHTRDFILKGGSVSSAATMLFKHTMRLEQSYYLDYGEALAPIDLPACRNDREIGFVSGMCGYETVTRVRNVTMQNKQIRYMRGPIH